MSDFRRAYVYVRNIFTGIETGRMRNRPVGFLIMRDIICKEHKSIILSYIYCKNIL